MYNLLTAYPHTAFLQRSPSVAGPRKGNIVSEIKNLFKSESCLHIKFHIRDTAFFKGHAWISKHDKIQKQFANL